MIKKALRRCWIEGFPSLGSKGPDGNYSGAMCEYFSKLLDPIRIELADSSKAWENKAIIWKFQIETNPITDGLQTKKIDILLKPEPDIVDEPWLFRTTALGTERTRFAHFLYITQLFGQIKLNKKIIIFEYLDLAIWFLSSAAYRSSI